MLNTSFYTRDPDCRMGSYFNRRLSLMIWCDMIWHMIWYDVMLCYDMVVSVGLVEITLWQWRTNWLVVFGWPSYLNAISFLESLFKKTAFQKTSTCEKSLCSPRGLYRLLSSILTVNRSLSDNSIATSRLKFSDSQVYTSRVVMC